jgi:light-regulated signal transduction histidine kinase (bacteriophytochrome)
MLNETLEQRVNERTSQLEAVNRELEEYSYSVSHDLRAPLRAINGFSEIIANRYKDKLNGEILHYFNNIVESSKYMSILIDDILKYSRIGRKAINFEKTSIEKVFKQVIVELSEKIDETKAVIIIPENLPEIKSDYTLLTQIFLNLLYNSLNYHRENVIPEISINIKYKNKEMIFSVIDNGIGIPKEYWNKVFDMFQRLHDNDEYSGTGIGLAIVKKTTGLLGGRVWIESSIIGLGSIFCVALPDGI